LHELIRQFAEMQLKREPEAVEQTQQRHQDYFITFLAARTADVKGRRQLATLAEIEADIDNVRLAWRRAAAKRDAAAIERAAECLFVYYLYRNGYDEGQAEFRRAVAAIAGLPDGQADDSRLLGLVTPVQKQTLVGHLLANLGYFVAHRRNLPQGQMLLEQALALLQQTGSVDRCKEALALLWLGWAFYFQGKLTEGKRYAKASFAFFTETEDSWAGIWALMLLGGSLRDGRPAEAVAAYQPGLTLCRKSGDQICLSYISFNIGAAATMLGDYTRAQQHIALGVTISQQLNNILGLGYSLLRQGQLEIAQGKYQQATQTLHQSWTHFTKVGIVHASRAQLYLGLAHHRLGDYETAARLYSQAFDGFQAANNSLERVHCLNGLGCLAYDQDKLHRAEQYHRESLALLHETEPEPAMVAVTLCYLGQVIVSCGEHRWAEASGLFRQALELALAHQLAPLALEICVAVTQLLVPVGHTELAIDSLVLAEQHEASTFETREKARQLLVTLLARAPPEAQQVTGSQGRQRDLWRGVQELLMTIP
jgi:tetratricopeptide (TPR) repeat protein